MTIIYESSSACLTDIPASLQDAQASAVRVLSCIPPETPYPSTEPKGDKLRQARERVDPRQLASDQQRAIFIAQALTEIDSRLNSTQHETPWCYSRFTRDPDPEIDETGSASGHREPSLQFQVHFRSESRVPIVLSTDGYSNDFETVDDIAGLCVTNPNRRLAVMKVGQSRFLIPPRSTFVLSDIAGFVPHLSHSARMLLCQPQPTLDLIVMDPPWSNRSVRRSHKYRTTEQQRADDPFLQSLPIIEQSLHHDGLVAIWVTNKPAIQEQVVSSLGDLGFSLRAEWVWIKITKHGQPVYDLGGLWRKPYEKLLLFQRIPTPALSNKIIVAVPDLHSRKPCLKPLFERLLPHSYTALEIFARYLVSGWWSWGDEVLKFQHVDQWESDMQTELSSGYTEMR